MRLIANGKFYEVRAIGTPKPKRLRNRRA
jgi:hypothetical protein